MKRWVSLLLLIVFVSIPIVFAEDRHDLIQEMSAKEEGYYSVYVFWDKQATTDPNLLYLMLEPIDPLEVRQALNISNINIIELNKADLNYKYVQQLGIKRMPAFVVLDHRAIVLKTTNADDIPRFLRNPGGAGMIAEVRHK